MLTNENIAKVFFNIRLFAQDEMLNPIHSQSLPFQFYILEVKATCFIAFLKNQRVELQYPSKPLVVVSCYTCPVQYSRPKKVTHVPNIS